MDVPEVVRQTALAAGAGRWLAGLPALVADLQREWAITVGRPYSDGTEAYVARAVCADGTPAVLKLMVPLGGATNSPRTGCWPSPSATWAC